MIIRREDFGSVKSLSRGSQKNIWFICDECGIGILQSFRNYLNQKERKLCRSCRNKNTAKKMSVKKKQSDAAKNMWKEKGFKESVSVKISESCKKAWTDDRRKWLSKNNPMKDMATRKKVAEGEAISIEELKSICEKYRYTYIDRILGRRGGSVIKFICNNGHIQEKRLDSFRCGSYGCYECSKSVSSGEAELGNFIELLGLDIIRSDRSIIAPLELDIVIPSKKIAIEFCGLYWHSELNGKSRNYHLNKLKKCNESGYRLITIFEDEWVVKQDIVKMRLSNILWQSDDVVYARKCHIAEISPEDARWFVNKYHIQGYTGSSVKLGAYYDNRLVAVMTFSKPSISKGRKDQSSEGVFELSRFCSSTRVIGIAGKLLKYFQNKYEVKSIYSFADRRWSHGNLYAVLGFKLMSYTKPNYFYFKDNKKRYHRFNFRKSELSKKLDIFDADKTEVQNMVINGWNRIFDCGNILYEKKYHTKC